MDTRAVQYPIVHFCIHLLNTHKRLRGFFLQCFSGYWVLFIASVHNVPCKLVFFVVVVVVFSVLRGHSAISSPPQQPMTSDRSYPLHYLIILILEKEPVFPFSMLSAKQGNYWYHFYNVFGMTRSLTGDWTRDLPHSTTRLLRRWWN